MPPSLEALGVYFDQVMQPRDAGHVNGWDYTATNNAVQFCGPACDALTSGSVTDLSFVCGCVGGTIGN